MPLPLPLAGSTVTLSVLVDARVLGRVKMSFAAMRQSALLRAHGLASSATMLIRERPWMLARMGRRIEEFEILGAVISTVAIPMMHDLSRSQGTSE